jgi:Skp family chaperone for outer membrane proteins
VAVMNTFRRIIFIVVAGLLASPVVAAPGESDAEKCQSLYTAGDYEQAVAPCTKAAGQGDGEAQLNLGKMYHNGQGVAQDYQQAFKWYSSAGSQGYADADSQYFLEKMYYHGKGAGAVLGFASPVLAEKFAVVNVQRAVTETEDGRRAMATVRNLFESRQRELSKAEQDLGAEKQKLEKDRATLTRDQYEQRLEALQREAMKLQQQLMLYQQELAKKQGELLERIQRGIMAIVRRIATQEGFGIVVDSTVVLYIRTDLDITDRVITQYHKQNSGMK